MMQDYTTFPVTVFIKFINEYLDLRYYSIEIIYWDNEKVTVPLCTTLTFGDALLPVIRKLDAINRELEVTFYVQGADDEVIKLRNITKQSEIKESKLRSAISLAPNVRDANRIKEFLDYHNCQVFKI
jgi:hypothetical protein